MGKTIVEKILSNASGSEASVGDIVNAEVSALMIPDNAGPGIFKKFEQFGVKEVKHPDRVALIPDHLVPCNSTADADKVNKFRKLAKKYHLEQNFYDVGRGGISHQVMVENGWALPGLVTVGKDAHSTMYGAVGGFGCGIAPTEAAAILYTGYMWFKVPETVRVDVVGTLPSYCSGKDVALDMVRQLGCDKIAMYRCIEVGGSGLASLTMDDRLTIANMSAETGAKNCIVEYDSVTEAYIKAITAKDYPVFQADEDASYVARITIDLSALEPLVALPHSPAKVERVADHEDVEVQHFFLGSCTAGRVEDIRTVAKILKGKQVSPKCTVILVPGSQKIYAQCVREGYIADLIEAGVCIESPSCACCSGRRSGTLGAGVNCVSTSNLNTKGRMGSPDSFVYLTSSATAAASALTGRLTDPRDYL